MSAWQLAAAAVIGWFGLSGAFMLMARAAEMRAAGTLTAFWRPTVYVWFVIGLVLDLAFNAVVGWLLFAESPLPLLRDWVCRLASATIGRPYGGELTFSERVKRHTRESAGWRWQEAMWWRRQLNAVAPGHI